MIKFERGESLREVDVFMKYDLMNKEGFISTYLEGK